MPPHESQANTALNHDDGCHSLHPAVDLISLHEQEICEFVMIKNVTSRCSSAQITESANMHYGAFVAMHKIRVKTTFSDIISSANWTGPAAGGQQRTRAMFCCLLCHGCQREGT